MFVVHFTAVHVSSSGVEFTLVHESHMTVETCIEPIESDLFKYVYAHFHVICGKITAVRLVEADP